MAGPWFWCLDHQRIEPAAGCPNDRRMGPYATREAAATALDRARERTAAWDAEDAAEESWGDDDH
jgi:hypothetical protein